MTIQRRRGVPATIYRTKIEVDNRGNEHRVVDTLNPYQMAVWVYPQRSARAEVPGQQKINVIRVGIPGEVEDVGLWAKVDMLGSTWDVVSPPAYHHGTRHTRHWSVDLRERPDG